LQSAAAAAAVGDCGKVQGAAAAAAVGTAGVMGKVQNAVAAVDAAGGCGRGWGRYRGRPQL
jgi:hypothetical protein